MLLANRCQGVQADNVADNFVSFVNNYTEITQGTRNFVDAVYEA